MAAGESPARAGRACVVVALLNVFAGGDNVPMPSMIGFRRLAVPPGQLPLACAAGVSVRSLFIVATSALVGSASYALKEAA